MADFAHLRRVFVSQRLTRGRRDFNTAALDFRAQQYLLSKSRVLDPDYAVKVLNPEEERESEKRIPGGHIKPPEVRFDPKGVRQPGQVLKLQVTAKDMLDESEKPNFGWVDPPAPVDPLEEVRRFAARPKIRIREYDIDPRTGGADLEKFQDINVKSLGDKIGGGGRSLIGRAARKLGLLVDDLGKFRCPPGTPNANQFTDISGSTCYPSLGRVRGGIDYLMRQMNIGWGVNPYHGVSDDVADRIGIGWSNEEALNLAQSSVIMQENAGAASLARYGIRTAAQMKRHLRRTDDRVGEFAKELGKDFELPKDLDADPHASFVALEKVLKELVRTGKWNNGPDRHGNPLRKPTFQINSPISDTDLDGLSDEQREIRLTDDFLRMVIELEKGTNYVYEDMWDLYNAEKDAGGGELYDHVEVLRRDWTVAGVGAMVVFLDRLDADRKAGGGDTSTIAAFILGNGKLGTSELTYLVGMDAHGRHRDADGKISVGRFYGADPMHSILKINLLDATLKQYHPFRGDKITQVIAEGDAAEGAKWDALHGFLKDQQGVRPFLNAWASGTQESNERVNRLARLDRLDGGNRVARWRAGEGAGDLGWHGQEVAGGMVRARRAETMQVTYHGFTHVQQNRIFRDRVESKLDADGKYTIHPPSLYYGKPGGGGYAQFGEDEDILRFEKPRVRSLYPTPEDLENPKLNAVEGVPFSHWTEGEIAMAVTSEMLDVNAVTDDFPPGGMPLIKDSMLDLLAGQYVSMIRGDQRRGQRGVIDQERMKPTVPGGRGMLIREHHLTELRSRLGQREMLMYLEATAELNAGRHMGLYGGAVNRHLSYLDAPAQPVRALHITEGQTLIDDVVHDDAGAVLSPHRLRRVQATADGRPIRTEDRAGPRINSMHARGVGSRGDGVQVRGLVNEEFGFEDGPMDTVDPDLLDERFQALHNAFEGLDQDRELSPNEKIRMYLAARGMEQILNENARRAKASDWHKDRLARDGKPVAPGDPLDGRWTDAWTRSLRSDTDELFDDLSGARVFRPPSIRETDEALSTHTATRRAIMMGGLSEQQATAIDADLPAKHRDLTDPEKLRERIRLNTAATRYADDHSIEISTSPDEPSPHVDREISDFVTPAMKVIDENPLPESITVRVRDENDRGVRQVGDIIKRDFTVGTVSSHADSDREDRKEPGEGASFRIEMQAGDKGVHRENDVLLPPSEFEVTSIDDNGDIVLAPISQQTGPQVLKNIENALDDMPAPLDHEEEHRRKMVRSATRRGQVQATVEEPEEIRVLYNAPDQMPLASVHRELNELANRDEQTPLVGREKDRLNELSRFLRMRTTGSSDLPDPDDDEAHVPRVIHVPSTGDLSAIPSDSDWTMVGPNTGLHSRREGGFRSARADVDLDENGVHTDDSGIRMTYDRTERSWRHLEIRRNPVRDRRGRSLLQQYTGRVDENGEGIFEDLPLVPNGDGVMFQWDGERWRPDLSQVPDEHFNEETGLVIVDGNGGFSRYDVETETWSDFSVSARDRRHVPSEVRTNWKLNHSGLKVRDSRLGNGTSDDPRDILPPLLTDIMYHGTSYDFDEFEHGRNISGAGAGGTTKNPDSGLGFHFSPFEQTAAGMSSTGTIVKTVHLDLRNPAPIADLRFLQGVRERASISALGLDELFEEMFEAHLEANFPGAILEGNTPFERLMYADRALENITYGERGLVRAFIEELQRVKNRHHFRDNPRAGSNEYEGRIINDHKIPNLELILTPEQVEGLSSMLFLSRDRVRTPGEGTSNDLLTREWLQGQGYDGLIIKEAWMGPPGGKEANAIGLQNSGDPRQVSYVAFDPEQITTANPPERTPEQQAYRERTLSDIERGWRTTHGGINDAFVPFDVEVSVGGEVLFTGGEREPGSGRSSGGKLFDDLFWKNHGEAAWHRDKEQRGLDEIRDEYARVGGLASRRNGELRTSLGEQQERLTENMRARKRTQDEGELAELAEDFEYLAGIERRDRREFNGNNRAALRSSRGSVDRGARARMQDKADERRAVRIENGVGGATGDIFNPDDTWVEEAIRERIEVYGNSLERREGIEPKLGGGTHDWSLGTRDEKVGRALDSASGAIEYFRGGGGDGNVPLPKAVRKFIADSTDEEVLDRLRQAVRQYVSDFDPQIRIAAKRSRAEELLADPDRRAKSTHEVDSQHSAAAERAQLELSWGIPLDAAAEVRPISGYLDHKESRELKKEWLRTRNNNRGSGRADFGNAVDPDFLPDYWADNGISPSGPATWVYGETSTGSIEFVLKADRANDSGVIFGDSARQGAKRPIGMTSTNADDLLTAILYPETTVSAGHVSRNRTENRQHVMSLLNGSLTGDWSGVLDPDAHQKAARNGVSPAQATSVSSRYAEALVPGGFDFEDIEHVSMPVGTFNVPEDLAPGDMGRNHQELLEALAPFNLSDVELDQLFSDYGSSKTHHYALYMRNYLGMLEKKRELRKLGLETVFPNHDSIDYFNPQTWLSLPPTAWGGTPPSPNSNVYELLQHLIRVDIIKKRQSLVDDVRRPIPVYDPTVSVV
jgi:hypothetical protein